jgi:hypothetical protein
MDFRKWINGFQFKFNEVIGCNPAKVAWQRQFFLHEIIVVITATCNGSGIYSESYGAKVDIGMSWKEIA